MPFLTGTQSDLIREAFDNLRAASGRLDELHHFRFLGDAPGEKRRAVAVKALETQGLAEWMGRRNGAYIYMPTEQGINEALRLGVISRDDVEALRKARERANDLSREERRKATK